MHLSQKQKPFSLFFLHYADLYQKFEHLQKNMTLIAYVFPKLQTPK